MAEIDKNKVGAAFDRAADTYDAMALFQHSVCERLATTLPSALMPLRILDGGCGTGYGATLLRKQWPEAQVVGCDIAPEMVRKTLARGVDAVCGDLEKLPFEDGSFDLVWSSLALQWCQPALAFSELQRVLAPGGFLVFSTLGPGTLHELESVFAGVDAHSRVLRFAAVADVESALSGAGFSGVDVRCEAWVTRHAELKALFASIRGIGASQVGGDRRRGMMGKDVWRGVVGRYEALRDGDGLLPVTYEVVFGVARKIV